MREACILGLEENPHGNIGREIAEKQEKYNERPQEIHG
jgi:hypothetical protein